MPVKQENKINKGHVLRIGTRGSPLALVQANMVKDALAEQGRDSVLEIITTSGDWKKSDGEVKLEALAGGKAQFAKEIEEAMIAGQIDLAVHSMKDMETCLPEGLCIPYMLPREDARDAFLSNNAQKIDDLPMGCAIGTVSVRRQAFLLAKRPDLKIVPLRGNVQTRIDKLRDKQVYATFLACAGLNRLGLAHEISSPIDIEYMLPAVGQGAVGIEMRVSDLDDLSFIGQFSCLKTYTCVECERGLLRELGGSCHTPIGVYAVLEGVQMRLRVGLVSPDGKQIWREDILADIHNVEEAIAFGKETGDLLKRRVPVDILANIL